MSAPQPTSLIVYGGAFDPPHQGHVEAAQLALKAMPTAELWIVPGPAPAGAAGQHKNPHTPFESRLAMCRLAFGGLAEKRRITISPIEATLPRPNFTVSTLQRIHAQQSNASLALLMGEDQLASFSAWRDPGEILALATLLVVRRPNNPSAQQTSTASTIRRLVEELSPLVPMSPQELTARIEVIGEVQCRASSTDLRAELSSGTLLSAEWLHPAVFDYIKSHDLYLSAPPAGGTR